MLNKLNTDFFLQDTNKVAIDLLGKEINFYGKKLIITETESYVQGEPSSHSTRKKYENEKTPKDLPMFYKGGHTYVYSIYGIYYCLNFVTNIEGVGDSVFIRGGFDAKNNTLFDSKPALCCKYLGITTEYNKIDICNNENFFIKDIGIKEVEYEKLARVGLNKKNNDYYDLKRYKIKDVKDFVSKI